VPGFRAFCLDEDNHILERFDFDAADDDAAIAYARQYRPGVRREIWELGRKVAQLTPAD
jgi:hypothetical protein